MPVDKQVNIRYHILDELLRDEYRTFTFKDLFAAVNRKLQTAGENKISERTLRGDIKNIQLPPYNAQLATDLSKRPKIYRYADTSFILPMVNLTSSEREAVKKTIQLLNTFNDRPQYIWAKMILHAIENNYIDVVNEQIVGFQDNPDAIGREYFADLLSFIIEKRAIKILYKPFEKEKLEIIVHPYYLKQYNNRWFLFAKTEGYEEISVYALDRICSKPSFANVDFIPVNVDFEEYFDETVGVSVCTGQKSMKVVLKVSNEMFEYLETKPILPSQKELKSWQTKTHRFICFNAQINKELVAMILSFGSDVAVVEPPTLQRQILSKIKAMKNNYQTLQKSCNDVS